MDSSLGSKVNVFEELISILLMKMNAMLPIHGDWVASKHYVGQSRTIVNR
jgi:hypothetical protein